MAGRRRFLEAAAWQLGGASAGEARFLLWTLGNIEGNSQWKACPMLVGKAECNSGKNLNNVEQVCPYCFQFLLPDNYRVRLKPKMKVTPQIQKLLNLEGKNYKLNLKQTKLLKQYKESKNALLITCSVCKKTTRHYGKSREYSSIKASTLKTPTFSDKNMLFNTDNLGTKRGKLSSTSRISTSGQSTSHSSLRTPKNAKWHLAQLKRLLSLEENKKPEKRDLKNFLSSL